MENVTQTESKFTLIGDRKFYNIGSHPSNDIVINGERVLTFHAMLDCRSEPYTLIPLSPAADLSLNRARISGKEPVFLGEEDRIQLAGFDLKIQPAVNGNSPTLIAIPPSLDMGVAEIGFHHPEAEIPVPIPPTSLAALKSGQDLVDEFIIVEMEERRQITNVEQSAVYDLTVINGSPIVSTFLIQVEGIPENWVVITPQNVNLNERARAHVQIMVTPPRKPTSTAGEHPLRILVKSYNHPGRMAVVHASLEINPYFDFSIGDLNPAAKDITWRKTVGQVDLMINNQGNSDAQLLLTARDEEEKCRFQFQGEDGLKQTGQCEISIPAGASQPVPVFLSAVRKPLIAWRAPRYPFRVAVAQPANASMSLYTVGTAIVRPLIGLLGIILTILALMILTVYTFTPRITAFTIDDNAIGTGGSTTLHWKAPIFTHNLTITGVDDPISGSQGNLQVYPDQTVNTYTLNATTWLWNLLSFQPKTQAVTVLVVPDEPSIETFSVSATENVLQGDSSHLRWSVSNANKVNLTINGVTETMEDVSDFNGERDIDVTSDTLVYLEAFNSLSSTARSIFFNATPPEIKINRFEISKSTIYVGDSITITWDVSGAGMDNGGEVTISGFDGVLPNSGELTFFPTESMEFVLTARNRDLRETRILPVGVLEPEDPPEPPVIDFFTAAPDTITGEGDVELSWSVSGLVDTVTLENADDVLEDDLGAQGYDTITVSESGTYVLTATYQGQSTGANLQITVDPAMVPPTLAITSVFPDSNLEMGDTTDVTVTATQPEADDPPPTGTIIVTDGTTSCTIELPETSCELVFQTAGSKTITATYQGDDNYTSGEVTYAESLVVDGLTVSLGAELINPDETKNDVYEYGETLDLEVALDGIKSTFVPDGKIALTLYDCDENELNCTVSAYQPKETSHSFSSSEDGAYTFSQLITLEDFQDSHELVISFGNDSFYNDASATIYYQVDESTLSPVSLTTEQPLASTYAFNITVTDENDFGEYSSPEGTVTLVATHTDGTTVSCDDLDLATNTDNLTSTASCTLVPTKKGTWTISTTYTPTEDSPHLAKTSTTGTFNATADVYITLDSTSPTLYTGVSSSMIVNISDSLGADVTRGTLIYTYNGSENSCSYTGEYWLCNAITPVEDMNLGIIFNFTPASSDTDYLSSQVQTFYNLVNKPGTTVSKLTALNPSIAVPPYIPSTQYQFQVTVSSNQSNGLAPSDGTVNTKLVTSDCSEDSTREFDLDISATGKATGYITFASTDTGMLFCYRFAGNDGYKASDWVSESLDIRQLVVTVSSLHVINSTLDTPPVIPGVQYELTASLGTDEENELLPTSGTVVVKLVDTDNSCAIASDRTFNLSVTDDGVSGTETFLESDIGLKACYYFKGNTNFATSEYDSVDLEIRKLETNMSSLTISNSTYTESPPYLPTLTYTLSTSIVVEKSDTLSGGSVEGKLVDSGGSCEDDSSDRTFTLSLGTNNAATGTFIFEDADDGMTLCYRYSGDDGHEESDWVSIEDLNVHGYSTEVGKLTNTVVQPVPPPYIPGTSYTMKTTVTSDDTSTKPSSGTVTLSFINDSVSCATQAESGSYQITLDVASGTASGGVSFLSIYDGLKVCYRYDGDGFFEASDWAETDALDVRKLNTNVTDLGYTGGADFPPDSFMVGKTYTLTAEVVETDDKDTIVDSGKVVMNLISTSSTCSSGTNLFSSNYKVDVDDDGSVTFENVSFLSGLGYSEYKLCYHYLGSDMYEASSWVSSDPFEISARDSTVSGFKTEPTANMVYTTNTDYTFSANVADTLGDSSYVPDGGNIEVYLTSGSNTTSSQCSTSDTLAFEMEVTDGAASGTNAFDADMAAGSSMKFCYRYDGDTNHDPSSFVLINTPFYIKGSSSFTSIPSTQTVLASSDLTFNSSSALDYSTTLTVVMSTGGESAASQFSLVDSSGNTVCSSAMVDTTSNSTTTYACSAASVSYSSGVETVTWKIAFNSPRQLILHPVFTEDSINTGATGSTFTLNVAYEVTWYTDPTWDDAGVSQVNNPVSYYSGESDDMSTSFSGKIQLTNFSSFNQFTTLGLTPTVSSASSATCALTNSSTTGKGDVSCTDVSFTDGSTSSVTITLTPSNTAYYTGDLTSDSVTVKILGNQLEQSSYDPIVKTGCSDDDTIEFYIQGYAMKGQSSFQESDAEDFQVLLGCEEDEGSDHYWKIFGDSHNNNASVSDFTWDSSTGKYTFTLTADGSHGCGSTYDSDDGDWSDGWNSDFFRLALYYGLKAPSTAQYQDTDDWAAVVDDNFNYDGTYTLNSDYEYIFDLSPILQNPESSGDTVIRSCTNDNPGVPSSLYDNVNWDD